MKARKKGDPGNVWELSGLREGDIIDPISAPGRNVIIDPIYNWPNNTVVYKFEPGMRKFFCSGSFLPNYRAIYQIKSLKDFYFSASFLQKTKTNQARQFHAVLKTATFNFPAFERQKIKVYLAFKNVFALF